MLINKVKLIFMVNFLINYCNWKLKIECLKNIQVWNGLLKFKVYFLHNLNQNKITTIVLLSLKLITKLSKTSKLNNKQQKMSIIQKQLTYQPKLITLIKSSNYTKMELLEPKISINNTFKIMLMMEVQTLLNNLKEELNKVLVTGKPSKIYLLNENNEDHIIS